MAARGAGVSRQRGARQNPHPIKRLRDPLALTPAMLEPVPLPKSRLEAITDGIFAVSMTLLVLDLHLPDHLPEGSLVWRALVGEAPNFDNYVISFYMLCVFWIAHLRLMRRIDAVDTTFTWLNLTFLLFTTFVPMLTQFAGRNPGLPRPAFMYGANLLAILAFEALMWRHALPRLVNDSVTDAKGAWRLVRRKYLFAMGIVTLGIVVALAEIRAGMRSAYASYIYLLVIVVGIMQPAQRSRRSIRRDAQKAVSGSRE
jgi:uncharacterized membrane protein